MKNIVLLGSICAFIILQMNCESRPHSQNAPSETADSLAAAIADSPEERDPWIEYSYPERQGKHLFERYCVVCHGQTGEGDGFNAYNLNPRPRNLQDSLYIAALSDEALAEIITFGGRGVNKSVLMPAYQNTLSKSQIADIVAYIRTFLR